MASMLLGALPLAVGIASQPSSVSQNLSFSRSLSVTGNSLPAICPPSSLSFSLSSPSLPLIYCGRGDKKTARGKRFNHSFGNARPKNKNKGRGLPRPYTPPRQTRKAKSRTEDNVEDVEEQQPAEVDT